MKSKLFKMVIAIIASCLILFAILVWKRPVDISPDLKSLSFKDNYSVSPERFDGMLRVVTWNLHYGEKLDEVIATLEDADELKNADLLLLQEIDDQGVENLASKLHYNYVFTPAVFNKQRQAAYGNAILSKWPLRSPDEVALPNWLPGWAEDRNAVKAIAFVQGKEIVVYSVHMDVLWMEPQAYFLAGEIKKGNIPAIIGGDFNTWRPASIATMDSSLAKIGMERLAHGTGYTFEAYGFQFTLDHIFSMEGLTYTAGVYRQTNASDHFPVWVDIAFEQKW